MAQKVLNDQDGFALTIEAGAAGERAVSVELRAVSGPAEQHRIDVDAALAAAAAAIGGGTTPAQVRAAVRQFALACRAQARTLGGWA